MYTHQIVVRTLFSLQPHIKQIILGDLENSTNKAIFWTTLQPERLTSKIVIHVVDYIEKCNIAYNFLCLYYHSFLETLVQAVLHVFKEWICEPRFILKKLFSYILDAICKD